MATPFPFTTSGAVGPSNANGFVWIHGITGRCTTAATITIKDGASSSGNIVAEFALAANTGLTPGCLPKVKVPNGCYATVTGTLSAVLYVS